MTQPQSLVDNAEALLEIEKAAAREATTPLRKPFQRVLALLISTWPGDDASDEAKAAVIKRLNLGPLLGVTDTIESIILSSSLEALSSGIETGIQQATDSGVPLNDSFKRTLPELVVSAARATGDAIREQVSKARALLRVAKTLAEAQQAVSVAGQSINRVEAAARWATNKASNEGLSAVNERSNDLVLIWKNERTACVHCLAYAGRIATSNGYPGGLTYGETPLSTERVPSPPLHPNCRCTQYVLHRDVAGPVAKALVREAKRSVLRGWSVPSESNAVRIDAAKRLLAQGSTLPKSVKDYAARAIRRGEFPRGRQFPGA